MKVKKFLFDLITILGQILSIQFLLRSIHSKVVRIKTLEQVQINQSVM